jgi:ABC-type sugar transport system permease subunit
MKIGIVYVIINCINVFALVYVINEGKPGRYNDVLMTYMYEQAFTNGDYGYACAVGVSTLLAVLILAGATSLFFRGETVEL